MRSFRRHLAAGSVSERTAELYAQHAGDLARFLAETGMPRDVEYVTREHVEEHMIALLARGSEANAAMHYRSLQQFFRWLVSEEHITASPMAKMRPPKVPERAIPVVSADGLKRLLKVCSGRDFESRRDTAILSLFIDTPVRRGELAGMTTVSVELDQRQVRVIGKGNRERIVPIGAKTVKALDRYEDIRPRHHYAHLEAYWLGKRGALSGNGVLQMIKRRCQEAGIPDIHPHQFRHTFAHVWRAEGGDDDTLMRLAGWKSRAMLNRYGASAADERAREIYRSRSPLDRL